MLVLKIVVLSVAVMVLGLFEKSETKDCAE